MLAFFASVGTMLRALPFFLPLDPVAFAVPALRQKRRPLTCFVWHVNGPTQAKTRLEWATVHHLLPTCNPLICW